mmetsp:Transcript_89275/g.268460  ORF Transcript_89275/g.268460 Transcript_89275/m.268460 type:complete len:290 (-) Transcript_89275:678-1547(-)
MIRRVRRAASSGDAPPVADVSRATLLAAESGNALDRTSRPTDAASGAFTPAGVSIAGGCTAADAPSPAARVRARSCRPMRSIRSRLMRDGAYCCAAGATRPLKETSASASKSCCDEAHEVRRCHEPPLSSPIASSAYEPTSPTTTASTMMPARIISASSGAGIWAEPSSCPSVSVRIRSRADGWCSRYARSCCVAAAIASHSSVLSPAAVAELTSSWKSLTSVVSGQSTSWREPNVARPSAIGALYAQTRSTNEPKSDLATARRVGSACRSLRSCSVRSRCSIALGATP